MKRLLVVAALLAFAAPAFASDSSLDLAEGEQPAPMSDAEFDGVVAGGGPLLIVIAPTINLNFAFVWVTGNNNTVTLTQINVSAGSSSWTVPLSYTVRR